MVLTVKKILVIDDDPSMTMLISKRLSSDEVLPVILNSFDLVKETLKAQNDYFLALVDLTMPGASKGEIVDFVLSKNVPVIVLSGSSDEATRKDILARPVVDYILKTELNALNYIRYMITRLIQMEGRRALIVNDSTTQRFMLHKLLNQIFLESEEVSTGEEALSLLRNKNSFSIVIVNHSLKDMSGIDLVSRIRKFQQKDTLSIIGITSSDSEDIRNQFIKVGANDILLKSLRKEEFNNRIFKEFEMQSIMTENRQYLDFIDENVLSYRADSAGLINYVSSALLRVADFSHEEVINGGFRYFIQAEIPDEEEQKIINEIRAGKNWAGDIKFHRKNGGVYWAETRITPLFNSKSILTGFNVFQQEITDRKHLEVASLTDPLTGIFNRMKFESSTREAVDRFNESKEEIVFAIILFDIDHFKQINDTYGHQVGDVVLKEMTKLIKIELSGTKTMFARWGGEEFVILLENTGLDKAAEVAEDLRKKIEKFTFSEAGKVTISAGVSMFRPGIDSDELIKRADNALYEAKRSGRNKICLEQDDKAN